MEWFYDGQLRRYLTQFMRIMSNFSYKDGKGNIIRVPVRYGNLNRMVAEAVLNKNTENVVPSAPFIACYFKSLDVARDRTQNPYHINKSHIRERAFDPLGQEYLNTQGANYTVEKLMPTPFDVKFNADIWTTNDDQKFQLIEQILMLFNPALEIQTSNNFVDWSSLSVLELTDTNFSSRQTPQGVDDNVDIFTASFKCPIWINPPAKVKKLGIITKIIASIYDESPNDQVKLDGSFAYFSGRSPLTVDVETLGDLSVLILDNTAKLIRPVGLRDELNSDPIAPEQAYGPQVSWPVILDYYPGQFTAGLSQIRLQKPDGNEVVGFMSLNPIDDSIMQLNLDADTIPMNTLLTDLSGHNARGTIDSIVDPTTFNPRPFANGTYGFPATDTRYMILSSIATGLLAWQNVDNSYFTAHANDIIQWDGSKWNKLLDSTTYTVLTYLTNSRTGIQYAWNGTKWTKSYEGIYSPGQWRLVL